MRALVLSVVRRFIKPLILKAVDEAVEAVVNEVKDTGKLSDDGVDTVQGALDLALTFCSSRPALFWSIAPRVPLWFGGRIVLN
jgi:hypothetical protein